MRLHVRLWHLEVEGCVRLHQVLSVAFCVGMLHCNGVLCSMTSCHTMLRSAHSGKLHYGTFSYLAFCSRVVCIVLRHVAWCSVTFCYPMFLSWLHIREINRTVYQHCAWGSWNASWTLLHGSRSHCVTLHSVAQNMPL